MPDPVANVESFSTAGIAFKIGGTKIPGCVSTPDMGSEPARIDVTTFDNLTNKSYIPGLQDIQSLNFDFIAQTGNFAAAHALDGTATTYSVEYPDGSSCSWSGKHQTYKLGTSVGDTLKFRVACTIQGDITVT